MRAHLIGDSRSAARFKPFVQTTAAFRERIRRSTWPRQTRSAGVTGLFLALLLQVLAVPAMAAPSTYSGEAPVASQSESVRVGALKTALADVVIRLSGDPGILARADVASAVAEADKYVLQYRYRRDTTMDDGSGGAGQRLVLVAEFDSNAVDRMLAGLGLAGAGSAVAIDASPVKKRVWLSGIHSAADYARGLGYLSRQSLVRQTWPIEARGDGVLIGIELAGDFSRWLSLVDQDGVMQVNSASPPVQGIDATLALSP
jgi:hypothetical protein